MVPLKLAAAATAAAIDAAIQKKKFWIRYVALIIPNEEMEDIMKIVKSLEKSALLIKH